MTDNIIVKRPLRVVCRSLVTRFSLLLILYGLQHSYRSKRSSTTLHLKSNDVFPSIVNSCGKEGDIGGRWIGHGELSFWGWRIKCDLWQNKWMKSNTSDMDDRARRTLLAGGTMKRFGHEKVEKRPKTCGWSQLSELWTRVIASEWLQLRIWKWRRR